MPVSTSPGGNIFAGYGGYIGLHNWTKGGIDTTNPPMEPVNFFRINVANWWLDEKNIYTPNWYSGSIGATRRRGITTDWTVGMVVWLDGDTGYTNLYEDLDDPEADVNGIIQKVATVGQIRQYLDYGDTTALTLFLGSVDSFNSSVQSGLATADGFIPQYKAPSAVLTNIKVFDSSESIDGEDGIVRYIVTFEGDSLINYLEVQSDYDNFYKGYADSIQEQLALED